MKECRSGLFASSSSVSSFSTCFVSPAGHILSRRSPIYSVVRVSDNFTGFLFPFLSVSGPYTQFPALLFSSSLFLSPVHPRKISKYNIVNLLPSHPAFPYYYMIHHLRRCIAFSILQIHHCSFFFPFLSFLSFFYQHTFHTSPPPPPRSILL